MFASQGKYLLQNMNVVLLLLVPVLLFFIINFLLGQFIRHHAFILQRYSKSKLNNISKKLTCCTRYRVTAFSDEPLIAIALVIGPLIELPVLACVSQVLLLIKKNGNMHNKNVPFWDVFIMERLLTTLTSYLSIQMKLPKLQT